MGQPEKPETFRSPWAAALWPAALPGLGQLYNRDYLVGLLLIALECVVNLKSRLNLVIFYTLNGQFAQSLAVTDLQWLLFYPCLYTFAIWQAHQFALEHNQRLEARGLTRPTRLTRFSGALLGAAASGTLGVIWGLAGSPLLGGLAGLAAGALLGALLESLAARLKNKVGQE